MQFRWRSLGPTTRLLLAIWGVGTVLGLLGGGTDLVAWLRLDRASIRHLQLWRLATHALVADDLFTLIFGGLFLGWLGSAVEGFWDRRWFLTFYFLSAAGAGIGLLLLADTPPRGWLTNTGALLGLTVVWYHTHSGQSFRLFGGPVVSARTAAAIMVGCLLLPTAMAMDWRTAGALALGALTGRLVLALHSARSARRGVHASNRPRMGRLEW